MRTPGPFHGLQGVQENRLQYRPGQCPLSRPAPWRQSGHDKGKKKEKNKEKTLEPLQFQGFLWRGRRDLNPRAGFIQPTPLAGEPLRPLGYFRVYRCSFKNLAERVGFEPTGTCAPPVFKTGSFNHSDISPFRRRRLLNTPYSIAYPPPVCQQVFAHTRREKQGAPPDPCFYGRPAGENAPPRRPSGPLIWRRPLSL